MLWGPGRECSTRKPQKCGVHQVHLSRGWFWSGGHTSWPAPPNEAHIAAATGLTLDRTQRSPVSPLILGIACRQNIRHSMQAEDDSAQHAGSRPVSDYSRGGKGPRSPLEAGDISQPPGRQPYLRLQPAHQLLQPGAMIRGD